METRIEEIERELSIPKDRILQEGIRRYLEAQLKDIRIEVAKISAKYNASGFASLWKKIESGKVSEGECFDDLTKLDYLEERAKKVRRLLEGRS